MHDSARDEVSKTRSSRGWTMLILGSLLIVACSGGGGGGSSPTAAPMPANIVHTGVLTTTACAGGQCLYSLEHRNTGAGCANTVRGVVRLMNNNGGVVQRDEWVFNPGTMIRPGEAFVVDNECCFTTKNWKKADFYTAEVSWNDFTCP